MKNTKLLIPIICILVVLLLALGGMLLFKDKDFNSQIKDNPTPNNNSSEKVNPSIISIGTKSNKKICAVTNNGNEIELLDVSEYNGGTKYTYSSGKLYLYLYKYTPGKVDVNTGKTIQEVASYITLGYIDLNNDNYSFTKLADINAEGLPSSIAVINNNIYFTSSAFDGIYKYNIDTKNFSASNDFNFDDKKRINLYTISNDKLAYSTSGTASESPTIGIIDIKSNTKKEISSNATFEYVYNGNIIYTQYDAVNNYSKWKYYEYNANNERKKQISDSTSSDRSIDNSFIIPVNNYYVYVNENTLYKYENSQSQKIYEFEGGIDSINLISSKTLNIVYGAGTGTAAKYGVFDLSELKFNNIKDENSYSKVIYLPL